MKTPKCSQHNNQMEPVGLSLRDHQSLVCDNRFERLLEVCKVRQEARTLHVFSLIKPVLQPAVLKSVVHHK